MLIDQGKQIYWIVTSEILPVISESIRTVTAPAIGSICFRSFRERWQATGMPGASDRGNPRICHANCSVANLVSVPYPGTPLSIQTPAGEIAVGILELIRGKTRFK
jgi:hypothetical protein